MLDAPIAAHAVRPAPSSFSQRQELVDSISELGISIPQSAISMSRTDRREFLRTATLPCLAACAAVCLRGAPVARAASSAMEEDPRFRVEARF